MINKILSLIIITIVAFCLAMVGITDAHIVNPYL